MNTNHYQTLLEQKQRDLEAEIARLRSDALDARTVEVEDPIDQVTSSENQARALEESARFSDILAQVRSALQRIEDGSYGICIDCGEQIEEARLNAVPWTPYCKEDQEKHDAAQSTHTPDLA